MEHETEHALWVLVTPAGDLPGQWIAHCLNLDVVSQGDSIEHAFRMAVEAVLTAVADDLECGNDPFARPSAPEECWDALHELMRKAVPLSSIPPEQRHKVKIVAGQFKIATIDHQKNAVQNSELAPPLWQMAALERMRGGPDSHPC